MEVPERSVPAGTLKNWMPLGLIALVAVVAGVLLPQVLTSSVPPQKASSTQPAKNDLTYAPPAWPEQPNYQGMFTRLGLGTVAVLGLCAGTLWFCKRWVGAGAKVAASGTHLRLVETLSLGNRCLVHLVHVGGRPVLIGADGAGVKTVVPLPEPFAQLLQETEATGADLGPELARR